MKSYVNSATGRRVPDPDPPPDSFFSDGRRTTNFVTKKLRHHTDRYVHYRKHPGSVPGDSSLSTNPTQIETSYRRKHLLSDQLYPQNTFGQTSLSKFLTLTSICSRVAEHLSHAYVVALGDKKQETVLNALEDIRRRANRDSRPINVFQTDNGKEFQNLRLTH